MMLYSKTLMSPTSSSQSQLYLERTRPTSIDNVAFTTTGTLRTLQAVLLTCKVFAQQLRWSSFERMRMERQAKAVNRHRQYRCRLKLWFILFVEHGDNFGSRLDYLVLMGSIRTEHNSTIAVSDIDSDYVNIGQSHTGGSVRWIDITYGTDDCVTAANGYEGRTLVQH